MNRKAVSLLLWLTIVVLFLQIEITSVNAATNGYTKEKAIDVIESMIGKKYDVSPKNNSYDCVDLANEYYHVVGGQDYKARGNGGDFCKNALPSGWERCYVSDGYTPQAGDVVSWAGVGGWSPYGHVALVLAVSTSNKTITVVEQSTSRQIPATKAIYKWSSPTCFIHPDFNTNVITYAKGDNHSEITLKWKSVSDATKYTLQRRISGNNTSYEDVKTGITTTTYTDTGLKTGQRYYYKVIAYKGSTKLSTSDSVGVYTKFNPPTVTAVSNSKLSISWDSISKAESYTIMRRKDEEEYAEIKTVSDTSCIDSNLSPSTRYYYWIQANCKVDDDTMIAKSTTGQSYTLTNPPTITSHSDVKNTSLTLSWNSVSGAKNYKIQYRQAGDKWDTGSVWAETSNTSYNVTNLVAGKLYWFRLYAGNDAGWSSESENYGVYLKPNEPIAHKTGFPGSIKLDWTNAGGNTKYAIYVRKSGEAAKEDSEYAVMLENQYTYTFTGLTPGAQYYFKVKEYNMDNPAVVSGRSDSGTNFTKLNKPTATGVTANSVSLSWKRDAMDGTYAYTYIVRRGPANAGGPENALNSYYNITDHLSGSSYQDTNVSQGTSYDYYIDVYRTKDGQTEWCDNSEVITVTTSVQEATGINVSTSNISLKQGESYSLSAIIYPDNANNKTVIWLSGDSNIATVGSDGTVTAMNAGNTNVYARTVNGYEAVCNVTVVRNHTIVDLGEDFNAYINYVVNGKYITREENSDVQLRSYSGKRNQVWHFIKQNDGSYKILSLASDDYNVLDVSGWSNTSGANVATYYDNDYIEGNSSSNQRWYIIQSENGYRLKPQCSECMIDVAGGGNAADGTNIQMWEYLDYGAQEFYINKVIPVIGVCIDKTEIFLDINENAVIGARIQPEDATNQNIVWSSSNESAATVSEGVVTAIAPGTATITATTEDGGYSASCTVTVEDSSVEEGVTWSIAGGVLTISGSGAMDDYAKTSEIPWYSQRLNVSEISIEDGITRIGNRAFYGCINAVKVTIPSSVTAIGTYAFKNCDAITIYGEKGSYAETYATENSIPFVNTQKWEGKTMTVDYAEGPSKWYFDVTVDDYTDDATVFAAVYDIDGKMLSNTSEEYVADDITSLSLTKDSLAEYAKVFVWNNGLIPITEVFKIEF